jgi:hypothetical protein
VTVTISGKKENRRKTVGHLSRLGYNLENGLDNACGMVKNNSVPLW